MNAIEWAKENPWTVAGIIGAGIVLYLLFSGGSGGGVIATVPQPVDHTIDVAQLQLQAQTQQLQYKLAETREMTSAQVAIAQLQANLGLAQASVERDIQLAGIVTSRDVQLAGIGAQERVQLAGLSSQVAIAELTEITNQRQIAAQETAALAQAATYAHLADVQSATVVASYNAQVAMQQSRDMAMIEQARIQGSTQKRSSTLGFLGSLASAAAIAFSDNRVKIDVQTAGYDDKGRRWVTYRYGWDAPETRRLGVMAQEVIKIDPDAVRRDPVSGYYRVDYARLS